jgi:hypothetical protein
MEFKLLCFWVVIDLLPQLPIETSVLTSSIFCLLLCKGAGIFFILIWFQYTLP